MAENKIPLLDCPVDYLVGDASGKIMNEYGRFPCKIMCGVYAFLIRGTARATIDITEREFKENDGLMLQPGSFLLIHEFSEDALVYYILFSAKFIEKNTFSNTISMVPRNIPEVIIHLTDERAVVVKAMIDVLLKASNCQPSMLTPAKMVPVFNLLNAAYIEYATKNQQMPMQPQDRRTEIYHEYNNLVMKHYHEWHHVSQYADAMRLTLPHLCSTIKAVSGKTAGDMIIDAILTDAKAQLKITNLQVKEIALALGFDNVAFFNRFFKSHTGSTPKAYRQS